MNNYTLRAAKESDMPAVLQLIQALASYEKEPDAVINTVQQLTVLLVIFVADCC